MALTMRLGRILIKSSKPVFHSLFVGFDMNFSNSSRLHQEEDERKHCFVDETSFQVLIGFDKLVDEFSCHRMIQLNLKLLWQEDNCVFLCGCAVMKGMELHNLVRLSFWHEDCLTLINSLRSWSSELSGNK
jgi:hypothetical protein